MADIVERLRKVSWAGGFPLVEGGPIESDLYSEAAAEILSLRQQIEIARVEERRKAFEEANQLATYIANDPLHIDAERFGAQMVGAQIRTRMMMDDEAIRARNGSSPSPVVAP